ncbi:MAG: 50S ribosomal protein L9 [Spirochaetes bacterium]|nr:MAG: 50S ribosomal protein L9 [Spirochaetota bacterium]
MKIILNQDVPNLGEEGDICVVADGYGRNFLLPKKMAIPYSKKNLTLLEKRREEIEKRKEEKRRNAMSLKEKLESEAIVLKMPTGETGKLFGSVTGARIAEELQKRGINVDKKKIAMAEHSIKMVGTYPVKIKLYENETAEVKVVIEKAE